MKFAIVLLCIIGYYSTAYGSPTAIEPPSAIDDSLRSFIESFRDVMPCGLPDSGIPPLSPLRVDQLPIDIEIPEATIRGLLRDTTVFDTHRFEVRQATFSLLALRIRVRLLFPNLPATTGFDNMFGRYMTDCYVFGSGGASANLQKIQPSNQIEKQPPNPIDDALRNFIERFRFAMPCGIPQYGIPILAPVRVQQHYIDIEMWEATMRGWLQNLFIGRTETFVLQEASFSVLSLRLNIRLWWPALDVSTFLNSFYGRLNQECFISGVGDANLVAGGLQFYGEFYLGFSGFNLQMTRIVSQLTVQSISGNVNGWTGTADHQERCRRELESTAPGILWNNQATVNQILSNLIIPVANQQLSQMTLNDLLNLINGGGSGLPIC